MGKKTIIGECRMCRETKPLTYEHVPPRSAFNKNTRFYSISQSDFWDNKDPLNFRPKGMVQQGGLGYYTLCEKHNSFLGKEYVRAYTKWANIGMDINLKYDFPFIPVTVINQNPLRILKQIFSMFISLNGLIFTEMYPEILKFVEDPTLQTLDEKFQVYTYLNDKGQIRNIGWSMTNTNGIICELAYPPYGFVLNIAADLPINNLTNITNFKNLSDTNDHSFDIVFPKFETHLPIPLDYRTIEEIKACM